MNFVGHIHVATRHRSRSGSRAADGEEQAQFLMGAALPDFATMGRFRLVNKPLDAAVRAGVDFHHRTDDAFHGHLWFRANSRQVSNELEAAGLHRGAAKACGHVGVELLLDGQLLDETASLRLSVERATATLNDPDLGLAALVDRDRTEGWTDHLNRVSSWPLPEDYRRPEAVARRLERILSRRPRLAFTGRHLDLVSTVLARHQPAMEAGAEILIEDLQRQLAP